MFEKIEKINIEECLKNIEECLENVDSVLHI